MWLEPGYCVTIISGRKSELSKSIQKPFKGHDSKVCWSQPMLCDCINASIWGIKKVNKHTKQGREHKLILWHALIIQNVPTGLKMLGAPSSSHSFKKQNCQDNKHLNTRVNYILVKCDVRLTLSLILFHSCTERAHRLFSNTFYFLLKICLMQKHTCGVYYINFSVQLLIGKQSICQNYKNRFRFFIEKFANYFF